MTQKRGPGRPPKNSKENKIAEVLQKAEDLKNKSIPDAVQVEDQNNIPENENNVEALEARLKELESQLASTQEKPEYKPLGESDEFFDEFEDEDFEGKSALDLIVSSSSYVGDSVQDMEETVRGSAAHKSILNTSAHNENYRKLKDRMVESRRNPSFQNYYDRMRLPADTATTVYRYVSCENVHQLKGNLKLKLMEGWMPVDVAKANPREFTGSIEFCNAVGFNCMVVEAPGCFMIAMEIPRELWERRKKMFRDADESFSDKIADESKGMFDTQHDSQYFAGINTGGVERAPESAKPQTRNITIVD